MIAPGLYLLHFHFGASAKAEKKTFVMCLNMIFKVVEHKNWNCIRK